MSGAYGTRADAKSEANDYSKAINLANKIIKGKQTYAVATNGISNSLKIKVN